MNTVTLVCPHCYSEGDHPFCLRPTPLKTSGSNQVLCENCLKKFRVYFQEGKINNVARV